MRRFALLALFCASAKGFWGKKGDRLAWMLSVGLFVITLLNLVVMYAINVWNRDIFDALENCEAAAVFSLSLVFVPLAAGSVILGTAAVYARMTIQRRWRGSLTTWLLAGGWPMGADHQLNLIQGEHQNPEYRIAEDLRIATDAPVDFSIGVVAALLSAVTFIVVLWTIGGELRLPVAGMTIIIPGFLVIAAVLYAVVASGSMALIGRRFIKVRRTRTRPRPSTASPYPGPRKRRKHRPSGWRDGRVCGLTATWRWFSTDGANCAGSTCGPPSCRKAAACWHR